MTLKLRKKGGNRDEKSKNEGVRISCTQPLSTVGKSFSCNVLS